MGVSRASTDMLTGRVARENSPTGRIAETRTASAMLRLRCPCTKTNLRGIRPGIALDFNVDNQVVGVEILNLSKRSSTLNPHELQFQTG
jgi:hypothetical protein